METLQIKNELLELAEKGNEVTLANIRSNRIRTIEEGWHEPELYTIR